ncbi:MAG: hypothetical protein J5I62_14730 [Flavobacteriales bacterium]|nr:hypothetical protein [Flavobacteriales bacterium]MEB2342344.1 hypothetical protein [Flavobacteriia bacterium]
MRTLLFTLVSLCVLTVAAQVPQRMSFQAVMRDASGNLLTDAPVGLRLSIVQGSGDGVPVYVETHQATTNANGLVTAELGGGTAVEGTMEGIQWADGPFFLRTESDPLGGTAYSIDGSRELLSVPYALHAGNNQAGPAGPPGPPGAAGAPGCDMVRAGNMVVVYTDSQAYGFYQSGGSSGLNAGNWATTILEGTVKGAVASEKTIVVYTDNHAYGFNQSESSTGPNAGNWKVTTLEGEVIDAVSNVNQVVVYTSTHAYGFYQSEMSNNLNVGNWAVTSLAGTPIGAASSRHQIVVYTTSNAYGLYQSSSSGGLNAGNWAVTSISGTPQGALPSR